MVRSLSTVVDLPEPTSVMPVLDYVGIMKNNIEKGRRRGVVYELRTGVVKWEAKRSNLSSLRGATVNSAPDSGMNATS